MTDANKLSLVDSITLSCKDCSLAELCLPRGLSPKEFEQFMPMIKQRSPMATRDVLYRSGDVFRAIYAVKSGCIKTSIASADGEEQVTGFFMPGELFGFDGLNNDHVCSAVALERSYVCELPVTSVDELAQQIPGLRRELFRMMSREINEEQSMLFLLAQRSADERLAAFLLSLSTRLQYRGHSGVEFRLSMSRHDIANYLGLAAETVSRNLGRLTEEKVISLSGRTVVIEDLVALRTRVEQCIGRGVMKPDAVGNG